LDSPWVGINYDPANVLYYRGVQPETDLPKIAPHVIHMHMKDQRGGQGVDDFPPLGKGEIDFAHLLTTLAHTRYTGPLSAELELKGTRSPAAEDAIRSSCYQFMADLQRKIVSSAV
jgi:L-ribulose-5-phosphate 3-epimerase